MATMAHAQAVKSLNKCDDRRRFVFKTFSQRINEIDINVYRSLDKLKAEPSEGSSFFRDCLVEWRELNTAADFILFYEEMLPFVQTLPLVLLQKEFIFAELESRLQIKARLSLEPILRLVAALSRDLLEDFLPFLPRFVNSIVSLLKNGGEKEPEIVEQIFTSWSCIMMYLQKYLICDLEGVLRDTLKLRYYPKDYIKEFMSESMSFLLRNAPDEQLEKGIRRILSEVANPLRKSGGVTLLYYVMRGTSAGLHSRAERVLRFLLKDLAFCFCDKFAQGSRNVVEVVSSTLQRLCEDLEAKELSLMWKCLYWEINKSVTSKKMVHLRRLLSVLTSVFKIQKGRNIFDYQRMVGLVNRILSTFIASCGGMEAEDDIYDVLDEVLQLMLCIIDGPLSFHEMETIALRWASVFALKSSSLLTFMWELLQRDHLIVKPFTTNMLRAITNMTDSSEEVICLLLSLCERQQTTHYQVNIIDETSEGIQEFLEENMKKAVQDIAHGITVSSQVDEAKLAALWGVINCYPYFKVDAALLVHLVHALRKHLEGPVVKTAGASGMMWQSLLGAALSSYYKLLSAGRIHHCDMSEVLSIAKDHSSCVQVLSAVADYLDFVHGSVLAEDDSSKAYHPELKAGKALEAFNTFSGNLRHSNKDIRLMTLRILRHFQVPSFDPSSDEQPPKKKMKTKDIQTSLSKSNVLQLLLEIEETPLTVSSSRTLVNLISSVQMDLSAGRIHEDYVLLVSNGMMGIFHNRFNYLWDPASECLAVLMTKHTGVIWDEFVCYVQQCQAKFATHLDKSEDANNSMDKSTDLVGRFNAFLFPPSHSTPGTTVLSLLLQTLQKVPFVVESRSREIIPLFLEFLGYSREDPVSVWFDRRSCKGKEWKEALKEWLTLLKLIASPGSFYRSQFVKDVLQNRLLEDNDAEIQMKALDCLVLWKDDFLLPYYQRLRNLISTKDLREELTTWSLSKESNLVEGAHRAHLVSLVIRILMPKVRKLKTLASRKHTSMHLRKAVLCFIAQLDVHELALFFALLVKPLNITSEETIGLFWNSLDSSLHYFQMSNFPEYFTVETISTLSWGKKFGFLHVVQHILEVFDKFHVRPFLCFLMGCVVRLMVDPAANSDAAKDIGSLALRNASDAPSISDEKENASSNHDQTGSTLKQFKEMRSLCLRIIALVLDKYEDCELGSEFWDLFFAAVNPLVKRFKREGSSSERPSSLFSCFLSMSKSNNHVTLLCRERNLVPDIFSVLMVSTASEAIKSSVLKFVENLLSLDNKSDEEDNMFKRVLVPNVDALMRSLHCLYLGDISKRKSARYYREREIIILKLLSKYILNPSQARDYVDVLLSFLAKSVKNSDIRRKALLAIQDVITVLGTESSSKILNIVAPLLVDAELEIRLRICDLLKALAEIDSSLVCVAELICDLNDTSAMEVDYGIIANTYAEIDAGFFEKLSEQHTLIILSQSLYSMSSEERTPRRSAYSVLCSFIEFSASILCREASDLSGRCIDAGKAEGSWTGAQILHIIRKFLFKCIGNVIKRGGSIKKEWIYLIREMVTKLPDAGKLDAFKALCHENIDVDFFHNIVHVQRHRRARALVRFTNVISNNSLDEGVVRNLFVPLFFNMLLDGQDGRVDNVQTACMEALASVSAHMKWKSYYALLAQCFRELYKHSDKRKITLRLMCLILDKFPFAKGGDSCLEIRTCLQQTVFPKIQNLMNLDPDENVNIHIIMAALKVLKLLPEEMMDAQLPNIIRRISNLLKNRLESTRDEARLALTICLEELGVEYLQFVVKILRATLKRGFELHVLGYTVNVILSKCLSSPLWGKLDSCLEDILAVVENDILGDVAEQKEVGKIASKMKETRKCKSFETLKWIAQNVTFKSHAWKILSPVTSQLQRHLTPKSKSKLQNMLHHIAAGILVNPSVDHGDLFVFIHGLVDGAINKESGFGYQIFSGASERGRKDDFRKKSGSAGFVSGTKYCSHLIIAFALGLLHSKIKKMKLDENTEELLPVLDSFPALLGGCLSSKYEDVVSSSLRCFTALIRLPLPSLMFQADKVKATVLAIPQSTVNFSSPLVHSCVELLTVIIGCKKMTLSSEQLRMLIQSPMFADLEIDPSFAALSLLKAIVKRKLVIPEIYDIANRVAELMVKSQSESICKKSSQILLRFLVDYDICEKRLQQHLDFLLINMRYEYPSGRKAVLEMLCAVIMKFQKPRLNNQAETIFLNLVGCLANDEDSEVRSMAGAVIKLLIEHVSQDQVHSMLLYCLTWYSGKKQQLWVAAAQALGLFIEVRKKRFHEHINTVLQKTKIILQSAVSSATLQSQDTVDVASIPLWKEAFYSLVMIEKLLTQFPNLSFKKDTEEIWEMVFELLMHPHAWLRSKTCELLHYYFGAALADDTRRGKSLLSRPGRLFLVAAGLCLQLKEQPAALGDLVDVDLLTANIVFAISGLHSLTRLIDHENFWSTLEKDEQMLFLRAFELLDPRKRSSTFMALTLGDRTGKEGKDDVSDERNILLVRSFPSEDDVSDQRNILLVVGSLLDEMGKLALDMEPIQMRIVFNVYKRFTSQMSQEECLPYAFKILLPVYKVCEGFTGKVVSDDLKELAEEVSKSIQETLGKQRFEQIYSEIKDGLKSKREKRKEEEKETAVVNPMRHAKRKLWLAAKKRENKKRRVMAFKMKRLG